MLMVKLYKNICKWNKRLTPDLFRICMAILSKNGEGWEESLPIFETIPYKNGIFETPYIYKKNTFSLPPYKKWHFRDPITKQMAFLETTLYNTFFCFESPIQKMIKIWPPYIKQLQNLTHPLQKNAKIWPLIQKKAKIYPPIQKNVKISPPYTIFLPPIQNIYHPQGRIRDCSRLASDPLTRGLEPPHFWSPGSGLSSHILKCNIVVNSLTAKNWYTWTEYAKIN